MDDGDKSEILRIIADSGLLAKIDEMTIKEFRDTLQEKGWLDFYDLFTIALLVYKLFTREGLQRPPEDQPDTTTSAIIFKGKYKMTEIEIETLKLIAEGLTNDEIADKLDASISLEGVAKRVRNVLRKLKVRNRQQACAKAYKEGLL